ncbi:DNA polymerase delta small subunit [Quillaja saponaria]|uniref:DNA polymerase delta small subunit n=1 Tax=Quillaja saponaria TaxID=32244 RepID=A0AAD7PYC4_QUISA|nr:DNA polymerase delta small subunit [Quillaja saponaria]
MRTLLYSLVSNWKPHLPVCMVLGLKEGKECVIVGTHFKHMKLKPSILDEYSKEDLLLLCMGRKLMQVTFWFRMSYKLRPTSAD